MANELQTVLPPLLETVLPNSQGNISLGINNLLTGNQIGQLTVNVQSSNVPPPLLEPNNAQIEFDRKYYNIFVVGDDFNITTDNPFKVNCDRVFKQYMSEEIKPLFLPLTNDSKIERIKRMPCLFANENRHYGYTTEEQVLGFGYVRDIQLRRDGIKVYPHVICCLRQQRFNEALSNLDLYGNEKCNEFNRMHWAIKNVDLIAELQEMGFQI